MKQYLIISNQFNHT